MISKSQIKRILSTNQATLGKAYEKLKEEVDRLKCFNRELRRSMDNIEAKNKALHSALWELMNEARGFLSQANPVDHGNTNMAVFQGKIDKAALVLGEDL